MEARFVSSNSCTKTLEPVSLIRTFVSALSRRRVYRYKCGNVGRPVSISCCQLDASHPEDKGILSVNGDWRTFRARLVAGEQVLKLTASSEPSQATDPDTVMEDDDHPLMVVSIGEKWVHRIHKPEKGCLLIATEELDGVHIFEKTVILLLAEGPQGATGIILNRPSLMSITEMRPSSSALGVAGTFSDRPLFFGGPLEEGVLFLLSSSSSSSNEDADKSGVFEEVMKGLYYGTKESLGCAAEMVRRNVVGADEFRFFDGCCAWEKQQLRDEIRAGYWRLAACSESVIGLDSVGLWEEVVGHMGPRKVW